MNDYLHCVRADWAVTVPFVVLYIATTGLDIAFGFALAFKARKLSSSVSRVGMMRKVLMLGTIMLAALFDGVLPAIDLKAMGVEMHLTFAALGCVWWLIHELLSITENAALLGLPLPQRLKDALAVVRHTLDNEDEAEAPAKPKQGKRARADRL